MSPTKIQRSARLSINLVIVGMWILFSHEVLKSFDIMKMYVAYSGFFILFSALLIELKNSSLSLLYVKYRFWIMGIWFFAFLIFLYGILKSYSLQFISRDIWPYGYFACLLIAARTNTWRAIDKMIYQQFFVGLVVFLCILVTVDITMFTRAAIERNTASWGGSRICWAWGLLYGWQYMFLSFDEEKPMFRKVVTFLGVTFFLVFGIIMLKRQVVVELGMMSVFKLVYMIKVKKANIIRWTTMFVVIIAVTFLIVKFYENRAGTEYFKALVSRSTESGSVLSTTLQNTRLLKTPLDIYNQASNFEILFGQGLGSSVVKDGVMDTVVESGFFTIFLKGGIIYLMIWYLGFFSILSNTLLWMRRDKLFFGLLSTMFIISSPMGPFFIDYFSTGYKMFWLGRCTSRVSYERKCLVNG